MFHSESRITSFIVGLSIEYHDIDWVSFQFKKDKLMFFFTIDVKCFTQCETVNAHLKMPFETRYVYHISLVGM